MTGTLESSRLTLPSFARADAPRLACVGIVLAGAMSCLALNWPGHFSYDSVVQLAEGRARSYSGVHPLVMSWLLGIADQVTPGAGAFVWLDVALIDGALLLLLLAGGRVTWLTCALAAAVQALPQLSIYPAIIWKDVLFAGAMAFGFALMARAARAWQSPRRRLAWLAAALLALSLAAMARQNGPIVLPVASVALGWIAARSRPTGAMARGLAYGVAFLVVSGALALGATAALDTRLDGPPPVETDFRSLQAYDLVAALAREPRLELGVLHRRSPAAEALLRGPGVASYSPERIDSITGALERLSAADAGPIAAQWRELVLRRPWLYLQVRAAALRWVAAPPRPDRCVLVETGVDGDASDLADAGLKERDTPRDDTLERYALSFGGTPVYWHASYAALAAALALWLLRRRRSADIAVAAMLISALAFASSFALISIACDYRYLYPLDIAAIGGGLYAVASRRSDSARAFDHRRLSGVEQ